MDPDLKQDMEGSLSGAGKTAGVQKDADMASRVRAPETKGHEETQPQDHRDNTKAVSGVVVDPAEIVVEQRPTEATASPPRSATGAEHITINDSDGHSDIFSTAAPGTADAANLPTGGIASPVLLPSSTGSRSISSEADSGGTDGEERSSTEGRHHNQPEMDSTEENKGGGEDHMNDLPTQLKRVWGASPPDRNEGLAIVRDMLGHRAQLDGILSRLVAFKVRCCHLQQLRPCS